MDPMVIDPPKTSKCTSCRMVENFSNYWTASIFFKSPENGTYRRVPQMTNGQLNGTLMPQEGGITVYYMRPFSGTNKKTTVFKPVRFFFTFRNPLLIHKKGLPHDRRRPLSAHQTYRTHDELPPLPVQVGTQLWR